MFKVKHTIVSNLLVVAGFVILAVTMAACGADSQALVAPIGLRPEAVDDLVTQDDAGAGIVADPAPGDAPSAAAEPVSETDTALATTGAAASNGQARVADRTQHIIDPDTLVEPSAAEIASLTYMREEEKLARDVYLALYELWGQPIFQNIAGSEQAHMDSVLMLLEQYGAADPATGKAAGEFDDPFFQSLYEELVAQGSLSQIEALRVGAAIEELDIVDLEERLGQTSNEYIAQVYTNLLVGSENHLRAFVSNLERQGGGVYEPVTLDQDAYQAIIASSGGNGGGYRSGPPGAGGHGGRLPWRQSSGG